MRASATISLLLCISVPVSATSPAPACLDVKVQAYGWAELKSYPPKPSQARSAAWAKTQEESGAGYFIAEYCPDGKIQSLIKRVGGKVQFRYDFNYMGDKLSSVSETDENGNDHLLQAR